MHQFLLDQAMPQPHQFISGLCEDGWKVIFLRRDNILRQAISHYRALLTGLWSQFSAAPISQNQGIYIEIPRLIALVRMFEAWEQTQTKIMRTIPCITLEYAEDLLHQRCHQRTADKVFAYLGAPGAPVVTRMRKQADKPLPELVSNYEQLSRALKDTAYASFLESGHEAYAR
jgi:LPS sulfotransferase NodH